LQAVLRSCPWPLVRPRQCAPRRAMLASYIGERDTAPDSGQRLEMSLNVTRRVCMSQAVIQSVRRK
jgi:hypothetical protein